MPSHGFLSCARCWAHEAQNVRESGPFRLVRDPGHWGATTPHTLVLGISKGNTQSRAAHTDSFDRVAFKDIRHRILEAFNAVGLLKGENAGQFERRFSDSEQDYAFASVVRCSITGMDSKKLTHTADSPNVIPAFKRGSPGARFVENCVDEHLVKLPDRTKTILLLGNTDAYIASLADVIARKRGPVSRINAVAYTSQGVLFVHLAHPSRGNGHFGSFIRGEGKAGLKRDLAREALGFLIDTESARSHLTA